MKLREEGRRHSDIITTTIAAVSRLMLVFLSLVILTLLLVGDHQLAAAQGGGSSNDEHLELTAQTKNAVFAGRSASSWRVLNNGDLFVTGVLCPDCTVTIGPYVSLRSLYINADIHTGSQILIQGVTSKLGGIQIVGNEHCANSYSRAEMQSLFPNADPQTNFITVTNCTTSGNAGSMLRQGNLTSLSVIFINASTCDFREAVDEQTMLKKVKIVVDANKKLTGSINNGESAGVPFRRFALVRVTSFDEYLDLSEFSMRDNEGWISSATPKSHQNVNFLRLGWTRKQQRRHVGHITISGNAFSFPDNFRESALNGFRIVANGYASSDATPSTILLQGNRLDFPYCNYHSGCDGFDLRIRDFAGGILATGNNIWALVDHSDGLLGYSTMLGYNFDVRNVPTVSITRCSMTTSGYASHSVRQVYFGELQNVQRVLIDGVTQNSTRGTTLQSTTNRIGLFRIEYDIINVTEIVVSNCKYFSTDAYHTAIIDFGYDMYRAELKRLIVRDTDVVCNRCRFFVGATINTTFIHGYDTRIFIKGFNIQLLGFYYTASGFFVPAQHLASIEYVDSTVNFRLPFTVSGTGKTGVLLVVGCVAGASKEEMMPADSASNGAAPFYPAITIRNVIFWTSLLTLTGVLSFKSVERALYGVVVDYLEFTARFPNVDYGAPVMLDSNNVRFFGKQALTLFQPCIVGFADVSLYDVTFRNETWRISNEPLYLVMTVGFPVGQRGFFYNFKFECPRSTVGGEPVTSMIVADSVNPTPRRVSTVAACSISPTRNTPSLSQSLQPTFTLGRSRTSRTQSFTTQLFVCSPAVSVECSVPDRTLRTNAAIAFAPQGVPVRCALRAPVMVDLINKMPQDRFRHYLRVGSDVVVRSVVGPDGGAGDDASDGGVVTVHTVTTSSEGMSVLIVASTSQEKFNRFEATRLEISFSAAAFQCSMNMSAPSKAVLNASVVDFSRSLSFLPEETAKTLVITGGVASVAVSGAVGGGLSPAAVALQRLQHVTNLFKCQGADEPMDILDSPLQLSVGSGPARFALGACLGNAVLTAAFGLVSLCVCYYVSQQRNIDFGGPECRSIGKFPASVIIAGSLLQYGTTLGFVRTAQLSSSGLEKFVAVVLFFFVMLGPFLAVRVVWPGSKFWAKVRIQPNLDFTIVGDDGSSRHDDRAHHDEDSSSKKDELSQEMLMRSSSSSSSSTNAAAAAAANATATKNNNRSRRRSVSSAISSSSTSAVALAALALVVQEEQHQQKQHQHHDSDRGSTSASSSRRRSSTTVASSNTDDDDSDSDSDSDDDEKSLLSPSEQLSLFRDHLQRQIRRSDIRARGYRRDLKKAGCIKRLAMRFHRFMLCSQTSYVDRKPKSMFTKIYGPCFDDCAPMFHNAHLVDFAVNLLAGIFMAIDFPVGSSGCDVTSFIASVVLVCGFVCNFTEMWNFRHQTYLAFALNGLNVAGVLSQSIEKVFFANISGEDEMLATQVIVSIGLVVGIYDILVNVFDLISDALMAKSPKSALGKFLRSVFEPVLGSVGVTIGGKKNNNKKMNSDDGKNKTGKGLALARVVLKSASAQVAKSSRVLDEQEEKRRKQKLAEEEEEQRRRNKPKPSSEEYRRQLELASMPGAKRNFRPLVAADLEHDRTEQLLQVTRWRERSDNSNGNNTNHQNYNNTNNSRSNSSISNNAHDRSRSVRSNRTTTTSGKNRSSSNARSPSSSSSVRVVPSSEKSTHPQRSSSIALQRAVDEKAFEHEDKKKDAILEGIVSSAKIAMTDAWGGQKKKTGTATTANNNNNNNSTTSTAANTTSSSSNSISSRPSAASSSSFDVSKALI